MTAFRRSIILIAVAGALGLPWMPAAISAAPAPNVPANVGIDLAGIDRSIAPGADFFAYANGTWMKTTEIPPDRAGYGVYWAHGVSHYLGMATHDVGSPAPLEPGVVLTVEPGIYIPEKQLGVRIEDTVLVTKEGCEILSRDVPKEVSDIERLMSERSPLRDIMVP